MDTKRKLSAYNALSDCRFCQKDLCGRSSPFASYKRLSNPCGSADLISRCGSRFVTTNNKNPWTSAHYLQSPCRIRHSCCLDTRCFCCCNVKCTSPCRLFTCSCSNPCPDPCIQYQEGERQDDIGDDEPGELSNLDQVEGEPKSENPPLDTDTPGIITGDQPESSLGSKANSRAPSKPESTSAVKPVSGINTPKSFTIYNVKYESNQSSKSPCQFCSKPESQAVTRASSRDKSKIEALEKKVQPESIEASSRSKSGTENAYRLPQFHHEGKRQDDIGDNVPWELSKLNQAVGEPKYSPLDNYTPRIVTSGKPESRLGSRAPSRVSSKPPSRTSSRPNSRAPSKPESRLSFNPENTSAVKPVSGINTPHPPQSITVYNVEYESKQNSKPPSRTSSKPNSRVPSIPESRLSFNPESTSAVKPVSGINTPHPPQSITVYNVEYESKQDSKPPSRTSSKPNSRIPSIPENRLSFNPESISALKSVSGLNTPHTLQSLTVYNVEYESKQDSKSPCQFCSKPESQVVTYTSSRDYSTMEALEKQIEPITTEASVQCKPETEDVYTITGDKAITGVEEAVILEHVINEDFITKGKDMPSCCCIRSGCAKPFCHPYLQALHACKGTPTYRDTINALHFSEGL